MTADDLTEAHKQQILELFRKQVGHVEFFDLRMRLGDDGIITALLAQASQHEPPQPKPKPKPKPASWLIRALMGLIWIPIIGDLLMGVALLLGAIGDTNERDPVKALPGCLLGLIFLSLGIAGLCCR